MIAEVVGIPPRVQMGRARGKIRVSIDTQGQRQSSILA